jgi:peptidoglycan hydrolase-like protein with peptidoglycan-binding domain
MLKRCIAVFLVMGVLVALGAAEAQAEQPYPHHIVRLVQLRLLDVGINPGPIDGLWGPKTSTAVTKYQRRYQLPTTGRLNPPTAKHMKLPKWR